MQSLTERDIDRLAKILGLLGSRHPQEAAAAAHRATEFLKQRGWQWGDILKVPGLPAPTPHGNGTADDELFSAWPDDWRGAVRFCLGHKAMLTKWERDFVSKIEGWHSISVKQKPILRGIVDRVLAAGYHP